MQDKELEKLHRVLLIGVDEIDRICRLNNIKYTLTGGSLIGAVRHGGFIPWDDDVDVAMTRTNYDKFLNCCHNDLDNRFYIQTADNDSSYPYGFAKLVFKNTSYLQKGHENEQWQKGLFIDVFPMDSVPDAHIRKFFHKNVNYIFIKMLEAKTTDANIYSSNLKRVAFFLLKIITKPLNIPMLTSALQKNMVKYRSIETNQICNLGGMYKYDKETTDGNNFQEYIYTPFEDREYMIIKHYDNYLRGVYGNYMLLPPEDKRHTHDMESLDFGIFI